MFPKRLIRLHATNVCGRVESFTFYPGFEFYRFPPRSNTKREITEANGSFIVVLVNHTNQYKVTNLFCERGGAGELEPWLGVTESKRYQIIYQSDRAGRVE